MTILFKLKNELKQAKNELRQAWSLLQMEDLKCRKRVLRRLGYCNEQDVIDTKGRVACEIDTYVLIQFLFAISRLENHKCMLKFNNKKIRLQEKLLF